MTREPMSVSVDVGRRYPGGCRDGHDAADVVGSEELRDRNRSSLDTDEVVHGWLVTCDGTEELLHLERWGWSTWANSNVVSDMAITCSSRAA